MDFRQIWLGKLRSGLHRAAATGLADRITDQECIGTLVERMNTSLSSRQVNSIMTGCACHYPEEQLLPIQERYRTDQSIAGAMEMLNAQFRRMLTEGLGLDQDTVNMLLERGMGPAGVLDGDRIVATKIPKSGYLREWLSEQDAEKRRKLYCHCPLVRDLVGSGDEVPVEYCLCGAGFYRNIWEVITEKPVRVEVLSSVMAGDDDCSIGIHLEG